MTTDFERRIREGLVAQGYHPPHPARRQRARLGSNAIYVTPPPERVPVELGGAKPRPTAFIRISDEAWEAEAVARAARLAAMSYIRPPVGAKLDAVGLEGRRMPPTERMRGSGRPDQRATVPRPDPDWRPSEPSKPGKLRGRLWALRSALRHVAPDRQRNCGWASVTSGGVGIVATEEGRCRVDGVQTCGSVWAFPCCCARIKTGRAAEIHQMMVEHGHDRAVMMTFTIRHGFGDSLRKMRSGIGEAWRAFTRGAPFKRRMARLGIVGTVRAMEVTHGPNGWHPHLHVLWLLDRPVEESEFVEVDGAQRWFPGDGESMGWIVDRWSRIVAERIAEKHRPSCDRAVIATPLHRASYLSKLGLEMSDPGHKKGRRPGHRTPLQIAADYVATRKKSDAALWRRFCDEMKGARSLTWSRGLKDRHGIAERSDQELAEGEGDPSTTREIARLTPDEWIWLRTRWFQGLPGPVFVCMVAEQQGAKGLRTLLRRLFRERRER